MMAIVYFSNDSGFDMSEYEPVLTGVIEESLKRAAAINVTPEVSVTFTDNKAIRAMNKRYRRIDESTDVLSFPMYESQREWPVTEPASAIGDIVISVEQAMAQSAAYGHSLARELGFLTAHSMLHLMGYDHVGVESENEMFALQEKILTNLGLLR